MKATTSQAEMREDAQERLESELATLAAHLNAATARLLSLAATARSDGVAAGDDFANWLAFRLGITLREAREHVRVAEALQELPAIRSAFACGELTFSKVRSLTRVATPTSEESLLGLAGVLTASQLERALRAFRRLQSEEVRETHELEYVDYHFAEDGSLYLRARLPAEDGTLVVRALEAARERVRERRRDERRALTSEARVGEPLEPFEPPRPVNAEALVDVAERALASGGETPDRDRPRLVVHVDAAALTGDGSGRAELAGGPVISPTTARRLGCDAEQATILERDGLPLSVGRARRTVPPKLRRLLEARDDGSCRFPGCERTRYLEAHHRKHWARGGETCLENLVLLCFHHHRLVHEGGYTLEEGKDGELRFRNRHGVLCPSIPRSPPGDADELIAQNIGAGLTITERTNRNGFGDPLELFYAVAAIERAVRED